MTGCDMQPAGDSFQQPPRIWRLFTLGWGVLFLLGLGLSTFSLVSGNPQKLQGWSGVGLAALLLGSCVAYGLFSRGRMYGAAFSDRAGLLCVLAQVALLFVLVWRYDGAFVWMAIPLLYEIIGGLPRRLWPLPLAGEALVLGASLLPEGGGLPDTSALLSVGILVISNISIALFLRLLFAQRSQLRAALDELRQAHADLANSAAQQEELAVLRERTRLARAMHDDIGHALVLMNIKLEAAELLYAQDPARGATELQATRELIRATMGDLRRAIAGLREPVAEYHDLPAALGQLAQQARERSGIDVAYRVALGDAEPPPPVCEALWYVAREALTNVERHAAAASASLTLEAEAQGWLLRVEDDGSGIRPADLGRPRHYGLVGMGERLRALGGRLEVRRSISGGTVVEARLPLGKATEGV